MDKYLEDSYRRKCRRVITNYFYNKINNSPYPNHICAFFIKMIHFIMPFITYVIYIYAPLWLAMFTLLLSIISWTMFNYLKGCFISNIEYKLDRHDFVNIVDPYLVIFGYPINHDTRFDGTKYLVTLYFIISFMLLFIRWKM